MIVLLWIKNMALLGYYEMPMDGDATAGLAKLFLKSLDRLSGNK